jgi:DNA polymerase/3'-5' exonuclease PolX
MTFLSRFRKTPANHSEAVAAERPAISFDRIDELTPYLPAGSLKDLREIADAPRVAGETYTTEEIQKINAIKEAFLNKLAETGMSATAEEIKGLFGYILGETEKVQFNDEKFVAFQNILGSTYLDTIDRLKQGARQGGGLSQPDYVEIHRMKEELKQKVNERKLPYTNAEVDQFIDKLLEITPLNSAPEVEPEPSYFAGRNQ